jgi:hypothetical protein
VGIRVRYIVPHGTRAWLRVFWDGACARPNQRDHSYHNAMRLLGDSTEPQDDCRFGGKVADHADAEWPTACEDCGAQVPALGSVADPKRQVFRRTLYATPDRNWIGMPEVGDCYWADWYECDKRGGNCIHGWTNCDGKHLFVHLPGGSQPENEWHDLMSRASNCTMRSDTLHRCWIVNGRPEDGNLHVDKSGVTCQAGGGSIDTGRWHGCLHNNELV